MFDLHNYLFNVFVHYADLIIPQLEINLTKVLSPIESIQQVINARHIIVIIYGYFVQGMSINIHFQLVVLLINKQNRCPIRQFVLPNIPPTKEVIPLFFYLF
jgi:hypothetical protein